ncbi:hypothetical protein [uncultured Litoreibacter sp.]|uniref:hypothetical protein n=1 Tax=uncultured Litoreibacter sp. TaxID=1392394 RepID=UPI00261F5959|nr:hypothetical protein [uncultured Litoreibacter sp.]
MIAHFVLAGQSNMDEWFNADNGAALDAFRAEFLARNPQYTDVQFFDAARGGSAILSGSASDYADTRAPDDPELNARIAANYWYDEDTGTGGPNLDLFTGRIAAEVANGTEFLGVIWAQGEADTTYVGANGAADYAEGLQFVLDALVEASGAPSVFIQALGDRAFYSEALHGGTAAIRAAQEAIADASDAVTLATTIFDLPLRDSVHLTDAAYEIAAIRMAIAISTGETSPAAGEALLLNDTTLLIQLDLAPGQAVGGTFDLGGFVVTDNGSEVGIQSATVTPEGLLRIITVDPVTQPTVSYGGVAQSSEMEPGDFLFATGPNATVPVLPFIVSPAPTALDVVEQGTGLQIDGSHLSETVTGLSGDDTLYGNAGHDMLVGGWGADQLHGGAGQDTFVMGPDTATDTVHDFNVAQDSVGLLGFSAANLTITAVNGTDLSITTEGGQSIVLLNVDIADAGSLRFHMLGTAGDNTLLGWDGADRIFAYGGDDIIDSSAGTDRITTGEGADTVIFGTGYDTNVVYDFDLTEDAIALRGVTIDELTFSQYNGSDLEIRTPDGDRLILRNVALEDAGLVAITNPIATVGILTGTEGSDTLRGTALDELFEGGAGTDRIYGGGGADVFAFRDGSGLNIIYDYEDGLDRILVDGIDFDDLTILAYGSNDAEVRLGNGERMVIRNLDVADLTEDDFVFEMPEAFV